MYDKSGRKNGAKRAKRQERRRRETRAWGRAIRWIDRGLGRRQRRGIVRNSTKNRAKEKGAKPDSSVGPTASRPFLPTIICRPHRRPGPAVRSFIFHRYCTTAPVPAACPPNKRTKSNQTNKKSERVIDVRFMVKSTFLMYRNSCVDTSLSNLIGILFFLLPLPSVAVTVGCDPATVD